MAVNRFSPEAEESCPPDCCTDTCGVCALLEATLSLCSSARSGKATEVPRPNPELLGPGGMSEAERALSLPLAWTQMGQPEKAILSCLRTLETQPQLAEVRRLLIDNC